MTRQFLMMCMQITSSTYSYFVDALIDQLIKHFMEQKGYTEKKHDLQEWSSGLFYTESDR